MLRTSHLYITFLSILKAKLTQESSLTELCVMFLVVQMLLLEKFLKNGKSGLLMMEQHYMFSSLEFYTVGCNYSKLEEKYHTRHAH